MIDDIRSQVSEETQPKKEYVVINTSTGHEYIRTVCWTVARGCYNRMKQTYGDLVKMNIESK